MFHVSILANYARLALHRLGGLPARHSGAFFRSYSPSSTCATPRVIASKILPSQSARPAWKTGERACTSRALSAKPRYGQMFKWQYDRVYNVLACIFQNGGC